MQKTLVAATVAALVGFAGAANAADLYRAGSLKDPIVPVTSWAGFYAGVNVGAAWNDIEYRDWFVATNTTFSRGSLDETNVLGGAQAGYNFQQGQIVYGLEVDLGYLDIDGSTVNNGWKYTSSGGFYGDITGRVGYALDNILVYAKGGAAFIDAEYTANANVAGARVYSDSGIVWGWVVGGGAEYMVKPNWSVKVEYLHFEFDDTTFRNVAGYNTRFDPNVDTVKVGLNYHLSSGYVPLK
jgi:outer membrane immunogenic protein